MASRATEGISVGIWLPEDRAALPSTAHITYAFGRGGTNGPFRLLLMRPELGVRATLTDEAGKEVGKTLVGWWLGRRFDRADPRSRAVLQINHKDVPTMALADPDYAHRRELKYNQEDLTPEALFSMKKKGKYLLRLEFQVVLPRDNSSEPNRKLVLPPVLVPVVKE